MAWSSTDAEYTLSFSVLSGVRPLIEVFPLERAAEARYDFELFLQQDIRDELGHDILVYLRKCNQQ